MSEGELGGDAVSSRVCGRWWWQRFIILFRRPGAVEPRALLHIFRRYPFLLVLSWPRPTENPSGLLRVSEVPHERCKTGANHDDGIVPERGVEHSHCSSQIHQEPCELVGDGSFGQSHGS